MVIQLNTRTVGIVDQLARQVQGMHGSSADSADGIVLVPLQQGFDRRCAEAPASRTVGTGYIDRIDFEAAPLDDGQVGAFAQLLAVAAVQQHAECHQCQKCK